jgi:hypothetical protein
MRQGPNGRRGRGRPHPGSANAGQGGQSSSQGGGQSSGNGGARRSAASLRNQSFDSNGPDVRVRGNAWQVHEKYQTMARDAAAAGDRVAAENYLQHAEHYHRIIEAINEATAAEQQQQQARNYPPQPEARGYYQQPMAQQGEVSAEARGNMAFTPSDAQPPMLEQASMASIAGQEQQPTNPFFTPAEVEEVEQESLQIAPAAVAMR